VVTTQTAAPSFCPEASPAGPWPPGHRSDVLWSSESVAANAWARPTTSPRPATDAAAVAAAVVNVAELAAEFEPAQPARARTSATEAAALADHEYP
jgi:hypothetical protein